MMIFALRAVGLFLLGLSFTALIPGCTVKRAQVLYTHPVEVSLANSGEIESFFYATAWKAQDADILVAEAKAGALDFFEEAEDSSFVVEMKGHRTTRYGLFSNRVKEGRPSHVVVTAHTTAGDRLVGSGALPDTGAPVDAVTHVVLEP